MNAHNFGHLKGFAAVALLVVSVVSCSKADRTATPDVLTGSWKVTDVTIVNEEAGTHRTQKDLNGIGKAGMQFALDRSYLIGGSKQGTWMHESDVLAVRTFNGEVIQFKMSQTDDGAVHLERDLPAEGGLSAALVFYTLVRE